MDPKFLALKEEFLNNVSFDKLAVNKFSKTIVIGFIASIGSGKSTISKILSEKLNLPILDNDGIRRFLNLKGFPGKSPLQDLVIDIARTRMKIALDRGISYIIDADLTLTYPQDFDRISSQNASLLLIKIDCPENIIFERLEKRTTEETTSQADKQKYFERQKIRGGVQIPSGYIFYTLDNSKNLGPQIEGLTSKIDQFLLSDRNRY